MNHSLIISIFLIMMLLGLGLVALRTMVDRNTSAHRSYEDNETVHKRL